MRFFVILSLLFSLSAPCLAAPRIHIVMFADTADRPARETAISEVNATFSALVPREQFQLSVLRSSQGWTNGSQVLNYIANYRLNPEDTFVYLHTGHGGRDRNGHFLNMQYDNIRSSRLRSVINRKRCGLRIVLTNSCNVSFGSASQELPTQWNPRTQGIAPVMRSLFLEHSGTLHMNSSRVGQYSYGEIFFTKLCDYLMSNIHASPSWIDVDRYLDRVLDRCFREVIIPSGNHIVHGVEAKDWGVVYWSMARKGWRPGALAPSPAPPARFGSFTPDAAPAPDRPDRLGIRCHQCNGGIHVDSVNRGGPATRLQFRGNSIGLEASDHILAINGTSIRNLQHYRELIGTASPNSTITVRNKRDGLVYNYGVQLHR